MIPTTVLRVLAIDPSTDISGVAFVAFDARGGFVTRDATGLYCPDSTKGLEGRFARIRSVAAQIENFVLPAYARGIDLVAYEKPFTRGEAATGAIHQAIGAYLALPCFAGIPVCEINSQTVKVVSGQAGWHSRSKTRAEREASRREGKRLTIFWANAYFKMGLTDTEDAAADALAVAVAAFHAHVKASQQALALPRARRPVAAASKKVGRV